MNIWVARVLVFASFLPNVAIVFFLALVAATANGERGDSGLYKLTYFSAALAFLYFVYGTVELVRLRDGFKLWVRTTIVWFSMALLVVIGAIIAESF